MGGILPIYDCVMRFEVPQFIDIEDKIFGPFTWRQFVYLLGGGGAAFILFALLPFILFVVVAMPILALAAGLAFYKVNNQPFATIVEAFVRYISNARLYLWKKGAVKPKTKQETATAPTYLPPAASSLSSLSRKLEINALQNKR